MKVVAVGDGAKAEKLYKAIALDEQAAPKGKVAELSQKAGVRS